MLSGCGPTGEAGAVSRLITKATKDGNAYRCGSYTPTFYVLDDPQSARIRVIACADADFLATVAAAVVRDIVVRGNEAYATLLTGREVDLFFFLVKRHSQWRIRAVGGLPTQSSPPERYGRLVSRVPAGIASAEKAMKARASIG
jgi:hypothetical protein